MRWSLLTAITLAASPAAGDFVLHMPVDCVLGESCHIQNYVDHLPSGAVQDFHCGGLAYDGHKGTDIALPTLKEMDRGVDVLAAAPGIVQGVRDGMVDQRYGPENAEAIANRECGNGVVIRHDDGWETQYCHMRRGSVQVQKGDRVETGTVLGQIGLSGKTQFPHLHLSVRRDGQSIDPFVPNGAQECGPSDQTLWFETPDYVPGGLMSAGFTDAVPDYDAVLAGTAARDELTIHAGAMVLFGLAFGSQAGDVIRLEAIGPNGTVFAEEVVLEKAQAQVYRAAGRRLTQPSWPPGDYLGNVSMIRDSRVISQKTVAVNLR